MTAERCGAAMRGTGPHLDNGQGKRCARPAGHGGEHRGPARVASRAAAARKYERIKAGRRD